MRWIGLIIIMGCLRSSVSAQKIVPADKIAFASQVLQRVGATYGFDVLELPKLVISPRKAGNRRTAKLELALASANRLDRSRLLMDEELFDICTDVDKTTGQHGAALAFVLSHEMAHFYLKHATYRNFAGQGNATAPEKSSAIKTASYQQEKDADQTGLLFAYLAGYDPESVLNRLFDAIYGHYQLKDSLPGHPTRQERQLLTKLKAQEFRAYGHLFAVGHALYCRENFAEAARCFEYVYARYPLKEAYTNFGVCRLQEAIRQKKKTPISYFALPFEVDPHNRLLRLDERSESPNSTLVTTLLNDARVAFRQAREMDEMYALAYLNGAITELLDNNPYAALGILSEQKQRTGQLPPNSRLTQGIVWFALGELTKAESDLKEAAATRKAYQADHNLSIFQQLRKGTNAPPRQPWQRLKTQPNIYQHLGCQAPGLLLTEIEKAPQNDLFTNSLIEQSIPPPFIFVKTGQAVGRTYFWVKMNPAANPKRQSDLYYVQKKAL